MDLLLSKMSEGYPGFIVVRSLDELKTFLLAFRISVVRIEAKMLKEDSKSVRLDIESTIKDTCSQHSKLAPVIEYV